MRIDIQMPPIVPVSYLSCRQWMDFVTEGSFAGERAPYPKRIPPKATKQPINMAGAAEPATCSGFLSANPMRKYYFNQSEQSQCQRYADGPGGFEEAVRGGIGAKEKKAAKQRRQVKLPGQKRMWGGSMIYSVHDRCAHKPHALPY